MRVDSKRSQLTTRASIALFTFLLCFVPRLLWAGEATLGRAADLLAKGSISEAIRILHQVIAHDASNADAHLMLGTALALQDSRSESISEMAQAVRLRPNSANAHNKFGMVLSRFLETKAAGEEFEKALRLQPNLADAHVNLALILAQSGDLSTAAQHLDNAIKLQGNVRSAAYSHFLRAKIWVAQNQISKSVSELERAVQLRPDYAEAWSDLGGVRRLAVDRAGAVRALQRAVVLNPDDSTAQYRLGQLYLQDGDARKAVEHLRKALLADPTDRATLYNLERALRKLGEVSEADRIAKELTESITKSEHASTVGFQASHLNDEGIQLEKLGDVRAALAKYRAALDLDPTGAGFELNYALALCRLGRWDDGAVELREVLRADPNNADAAKALYIANEQVKSQSRDIR